MLREQMLNTAVTAIVRFKAQPSFVHTLSDITDRVVSKFKYEHWNIGPQRVLFKIPLELRNIYIDHARIQMQTFDLEKWESSQNEFFDNVRLVLDGYALKVVEEVTCVYQSFLDVGMNAAEIANLGFGSFLLEKQAAHEVISDPNDWVVHLISRSDENETRLEITPMTKSQAETAFKAAPNIENCVAAPLWDTTLASRLEIVARECLFLKTGISRTKDVPSHDIEKFFRESLPLAEKYATSIVKKIKHLV